MTTHVAYCVPCDILVEVRLEDGQDRITADSVSCPAVADACGTGPCPLARVSPAQLRAQLDFLPGASGGRAERGLGESARMVEQARRRSLGREAERVRRWWDGTRST